MSIINTTTLDTAETTTANFATISYANIIQGDAYALASLRKACEQDGFWYLDLREMNGEPMRAVQDVPCAFKAVDEFFELESEEKTKYDVDVIGPWKLNGYTPFGRNIGLAGDGKKHGVEGYTFPRDGVCNLIKSEDNCCLPPTLQKQSTFFASFMNQLHDLGLGLLNALDQIRRDSGLSEALLTANHQPSEVSTTCLTVQRYPSLSVESPTSGLSAHTDVGSLTILFCGERGLQTLNPNTKEWQYVEPKDGCAVVNVGDSLRFLSDKKFRSVVHRVAPYPGTTIRNRFSCAYFIRPKLDAEFLDEEGKRWKSIDWHMRKYKSYREMGQTV